LLSALTVYRTTSPWPHAPNRAVFIDVISYDYVREHNEPVNCLDFCPRATRSPWTTPKAASSKSRSATAAASPAQARRRLRPVPYKGSAPALANLIAGHVTMMFDHIPSVLPQIKRVVRALSSRRPSRRRASRG
jgi:hypothetical protein